jgi:hypothetical protein
VRDFLPLLGDRLAEATDAVASTPAARPERRHRCRRLSATLAGLLGSVAAIAGSALLLTGTSDAQLAVLDTPTVDARAIVAHLGAAGRALALSRALAFRTPSGAGYVTQSYGHDRICVLLPDATPMGDAWSSHCATTALAERDGLVAWLAGDRATDPAATTTVAYVLPTGTRGVQLGGRPLRGESGVVVATVDHDAELVARSGGRTIRRLVSGPFDTSRLTYTCPDGHAVDIRLADAGGRPGDVGHPVDPRRVC